MTKQEFKTTFLKNLRFYLPDEHKDVKILMRLFKVGKEDRLIDTEIKSVRAFVYGGRTWRIELRAEVTGISEMIQFALYKTADVSWNYKGKGVIV